MRFMIERTVCAEVGSIDELHELDDAVEEAIEAVVGDRLRLAPDGTRAGSGLSGLDEESRAALDHDFDEAQRENAQGQV